jgi:hypothetical protein
LSSRRPITCTRSSRPPRWMSASMSTCRSRSAGPVQEARTSSRRRRRLGSVTQMGNQGHSRGRSAPWIRIHHLRRDRRDSRGPRLDEPAARLLAAGRPRPTPPETLKWDGKSVDTRLAAALGAGYAAPKDLAWDLFLGVAPPVEYHRLSPVQLARMDGLGAGRAR